MLGKLPVGDFSAQRQIGLRVNSVQLGVNVLQQLFVVHLLRGQNTEHRSAAVFRKFHETGGVTIPGVLPEVRGGPSFRIQILRLQRVKPQLFPAEQGPVLPQAGRVLLQACPGILRRQQFLRGNPVHALRQLKEFLLCEGPF